MGSRRGSDSPSFVAHRASIGAAIRQLRRGRYSLTDLAARADISSGQLSQIENGRGNPTVEMLMRISMALDVQIEELLEPRGRAVTTIVHPDDRRQATMRPFGNTVQLLTPGPRHRFSVTHGEVAIGESVETGRYGGEGIIYIMEGHLTVHLNDSTYLLGATDSLLWQTIAAHRVTNAGNTTVKWIGVFRPDSDA